LNSAQQAGTLNVSKNPENFSRGFLQAAQEATSLMNGAASVSRITFPCYVWHFVFSKRRRMTVFSRITFRFAASYDS